MTTTSVFQGIGEGSKISSRVTNPSGGSGRHSETQREPKTVRVLKPPGGESSISFGDHDFTKRPAKYGAQESPKVENGKTEPPKDTLPTPQEEKKDETDEASTPQELETTPANETNGTVKITNGSSDPIPSSPAPLSPTEVIVDGSLDAPSAETPTTNGSSDGNAHEIIENGSHHDTVQNDNNTKDCACTLPETSEPVANDSPTNDSFEYKTKANLPPLHIKTSTSTHSSSQNSPTAVTPSVSSPTVSSPSAKGQEGTKDRLFGSPVARPSPPVEQSQPRKVVDHMRSSIFGPDDSYVPRASRNNAPAPTVTSPQEPIERPTAGQRGRVPPGGFSTKLW